MLTSGEYRDGDQVVVTIKAKIGGRAQGPSGPLLELRTDDGRLVTRVWPGSPGVTIERLAPPEPEIPAWFPPAPGSLVGNDAGLRYLRLDGKFTDRAWVSPGNFSYTDADVLSIKGLTLLWGTPGTAEPLHTWPPDEPGLYYETAVETWRSILVSGDIRVACDSGQHYTPYEAEKVWGTFTPIPAPGGASC